MLFFLIPFFLCWGSFLNVAAYRLIAGISLIRPRSFCPYCKQTIAWYDNIPLFSWLFLSGKCRHCKKPISWLYPCTEALTALLFSFLYVHISHHYFIPYFIFISALIVTIRSDIETMLISQYVTLFLVPVAFGLAWFNMLPITIFESVIGALCGYFFLLTINYVFKKITHKDGIGEGDFDLLCLIGAFTGILGCWASVTIGSMIGSLYGMAYMLYTRYASPHKIMDTRIPFGPFLAIGALVYVFYQRQLLEFFL